MHNIPPLIAAVAFALPFLLLTAALGRRLLLLVRLAPGGLQPVERALLEFTIGIGAIQFLPLGLAAVNQLSSWSVRVGVLLLALALSPDLWRVLQDILGIVQRTLKRLRDRGALVWVSLLTVLLAILLAHSMFLGFTDDDGYHLAAPWRWLREGTVSYLPSYTHTNAGLAFELSYLIALAFNSVLGAKLLHYATGILLLIATLACAKRISSWALGAAVVSMILITTPLVQTPLLFTLAYSDFPVCLSVMVAVMLWLVWRESGDRRLLWCIALCAGFTASFKFTALAVMGAWALLVALEFHFQGRRLIPAFTDLVKFGLLAVIPTLPWFLRNWHFTGNPLYPMAASLIPSRDWSVEQGVVFSTYIKYFSWGVASGAQMDVSIRKLLILAAIGLVLAGSALVVWFVKDRRLRMLACFSAAYVVICIALTGLVFRYWLPGVICMLLVLWAALERLPRYPFVRPPTRYIPAAILMAVALGVQANQEFRKGVLLRDIRVATGISSHDAETAADPAEQTWRYIQSSTPSDARILVGAFYSTFGASSFGCFRAQRHCFTTDSHLQTYINLTDWQAFVKSVKEAGIEYLLVSDQEFSANRQGFAYRAGRNEYPFCMQLAATAGTKVFQAGHFQVYRLDGLRAVGEP